MTFIAEFGILLSWNRLLIRRSTMNGEAAWKLINALKGSTRLFLQTLGLGPMTAPDLARNVAEGVALSGYNIPINNRMIHVGLREALRMGLVELVQPPRGRGEFTYRLTQIGEAGILYWVMNGD